MIHREGYVYICSPCGGPIVYYPDPTKIVSGARSKVGLSIANGKGGHFSSFELQELENGDNILKVGWMDDYRIIVVTRKRFIYVYSTDGTLLSMDDTFTVYKFRQGSPKLKEVHFYGLGLIMLINVEVVDPNTQNKLERSYIVIGMYNQKTNHIELTRKMYPSVNSILPHYNRYDHTLYALIENAQGKFWYAENLFYYFKYPQMKPSLIEFSDERKRDLEVLSKSFSVDGRKILTLQKDAKTQTFEINIYDFGIELSTIKSSDPQHPTEVINLPNNTYKLNFIYSYDFDQSAHLGANSKLFWIDDDLFCVEIYNNVFQTHSITSQTDETLIDTISTLYSICQETDGVRLHAIEDTAKGKEYSVVVYCSMDKDLQLLNEESPASQLWRSFVSPQDAALVTKFAENVYVSIETICKAALFLPKSDPRQIQLMKCASYGLMLAAPEDAKKGSPFMQTIVKLLRLLNTFQGSGCLMTYKEFFELAAIERNRKKDPNHNHGPDCGDIPRHPVQALLVSLENFSLCAAWSSESSLSLPALEEEWCKRKISKLTRSPNPAEIPKLVSHLHHLTTTSLYRVVDFAFRLPQIPRLDLLSSLATLSPIARDHIFRTLNLPPRDAQHYYGVLHKIALANCDSLSYFTLLDKLLLKNSQISTSDFSVVRSIIEPTASALNANEIPALNAAAINDSSVMQSAASLITIWGDSWAKFKAITSRQNVQKSDLVEISSAVCKIEGSTKFLKRVFFDDLWIWEINGDKPWKEVVDKIMASSKMISGVDSDSIYDQCKSFYRGFELDEKVVEHDVLDFKTKNSVDDKIVLRAKIAVIEEIGNQEEKCSRIESFLSVKKLEPFAAELLAQIAHNEGLIDARNKFLRVFDTKKPRKLNLLLKMGDESSAWDCVKTEKDRELQLQLARAMMFFDLKDADVKLSVEGLLKQFSS
ncbi:Vps16 N-terminal domain-containing protein [Entamoeba marina]